MNTDPNETPAVAIIGAGESSSTALEIMKEAAREKLRASGDYVQRAGMPRRRGPSGLMQILAMTAALGGPMLLSSYASKGRRELTDDDRQNLAAAKERRARKAAKKADHQRRSDAGKRHTGGK